MGAIVNNKEITFEKWSQMWDNVFYVCERREDFRALLAHTSNYKSEWNRGK